MSERDALHARDPARTRRAECFNFKEERAMNPFRKFIFVLISLTTLFGLQACETNDGEGAFENAGEEIDQAGDRIEEQVEEI